jgi:hypothetical protein
MASFSFSGMPPYVLISWGLKLPFSHVTIRARSRSHKRPNHHRWPKTDLLFPSTRFLSHTIQTSILNPARLPSILRTLRAVIFPNNTLAPARVPPTAEEALAIRRKCARTIISLIPDRICDVYFGRRNHDPGPQAADEGERGSSVPDDLEMERRLVEIEDVLDIFSDPYCNRHLMYSIVELVLVRLLPELAERQVGELLEERLS